MNAKRIVVLVVIATAATLLWGAAVNPARWSEEEIAEIASMSISELERLPADPTNRVADDPQAVAFGHKLFFDERLSANGKVSCATCHLPEKQFQDGTPLAAGVGTTNRRTMPVAGTAYSPFLFWDGRKDSQWAQALGPLESPVEHGGTRAQYAHIINVHYREEYERIFGGVPDLTGVPAVAGPVPDPRAAQAWESLTPSKRDRVTRIYANIGKAIAAYERRIQYGRSRFDEFADALASTGKTPRGILSDDEIAGLKLFVGKANCVQCHNGPLLTNNEFHNTGVPANPALPADHGRMSGASDVVRDEFNCRSRWSDAPERCAELDFIVTDSHELQRGYKVPSLRNVAGRAPYMHAGQLATLGDVLNHYNRAPVAPAGHSELEPLSLQPGELRQLEAFLRTLSGPVNAPADLLKAPAKTLAEK